MRFTKRIDTSQRPVQISNTRYESTFLGRTFREEKWVLYFDGGWRVMERSRSPYWGPWGEWQVTEPTPEERS